MSQHSVEDVEALKSAPTERYRADPRRCTRGRLKRWTWEVDLVTTHVILPVDKRTNDAVWYARPIDVESRLEHPPVVLGERWARWKGRRMVAAAKRRDVREEQPWVVGG